jgi:hypothetical protein
MLMVFLKTVVVGILTIIISPLATLLVLFTAGLVIELIAKIFLKSASELSLVKLRWFFQFACRGFTVGVLNALAIYFLKLNTLVLIVMFAVYVVYFMKEFKTEYVLNRLAEGDTNKYKRISNKAQTVTMISYIIGLCFIVGA